MVSENNLERVLMNLEIVILSLIKKLLIQLIEVFLLVFKINI